MAKIGFIGAGNMASSLIGGMLATDYLKEDIIAADPNPGDDIRALGIELSTDNAAVASSVEILILAVKPQILKTICQNLSTAVKRNNPLIISVAAGIQIDSINHWLDHASPVIRVMPNTPALISLGMSGLYANSQCSGEQKNRAMEIMLTVGKAVWLNEEQQIDAVTAISGSGPAYFFLFIEGLIEAAKSLGLSDEISQTLALQTALGAATMASQSEIDPAVLRKRVTSPGGTTEQAIKTFIEGNLAELIQKATQAAADRSVSLSKELGK